MVKGLQQQLWGSGTGEVQTHNLVEWKENVEMLTMSKSFLHFIPFYLYFHPASHLHIRQCSEGTEQSHGLSRARRST